MTYRIGDWEVDTAAACLRRGGEDIHIRVKTFQVLLLLIEQRGRIVTRAELLDQFWTNTSVTQDTLTQSITELRRVFGDDRREPRFIRTISKVGYQFIGPLDDLAPVETPPPRPDRTRLFRTAAIVATVAAIAAAVTLYALSRKPEIPHGEVAWWRLDDGSGKRASDASASGIHGSLLGDSAWIEGKRGLALRFAGNGSVEGEDRQQRLPRGSAPRTITLWMRTDSANGDDTNLLRYGRAGSGSHFHLFLAQTGRVGFGYDNGPSSLLSDTPLSDGAWHFLAGRYDGATANTASLFVDGAITASAKLPLVPNTGGGPRWYIGGVLASRTQYRGDLDDLRVYARSLTAAEVQALYRCSAAVPDVKLPDDRAGYLMALGDRDPASGSIQLPASAAGGQSIRHLGDDHGAIQFAAPNADCAIERMRGANVGQDVYQSVEVRVPSSGANNLTAAGPYFRSRAAAPGDGFIGGTSAGYWVLVDSTGVVRVRCLNPHTVVAFSAPAEPFDRNAFHQIEAAVQGESLQVALDGRIVTFEQGGRQTTVVSVPPTWQGPPAIGNNRGTAGVAFMAIPRGGGGGQEVRNIVVAPYRPLSITAP